MMKEKVWAKGTELKYEWRGAVLYQRGNKKRIIISRKFKTKINLSTAY